MNGRDRVRRYLTADGEAVIIAASLGTITNESMGRLRALPPAALVLGEAMVGAALIQGLPDRQPDEKLEVQWRSQGPFGSLFVDVRDLRQIRGTLTHPQPEVSEIRSSMGPGHLQIQRVQKNRSTGIIESTGNVVTDYLSYLERSEQKLCSMGVWVNIAARKEATDVWPFQVKEAYGYLVHVMPARVVSEQDARLWRWHSHLESLGPMSHWMFKNDPLDDIGAYISAELNPRITWEQSLEFSCTCNEERAGRALALANDKQKEFSNETNAGTNSEADAEVIRCEFCGRVYRIKAP